MTASAPFIPMLLKVGATRRRLAAAPQRVRDKVNAQAEFYTDAKEKARRRRAFILTALLDEFFHGTVVFERNAHGTYDAHFIGTSAQFQALDRPSAHLLLDARWSLKTLRYPLSVGDLVVDAMDENRTPLRLIQPPILPEDAA
ncbi:hypothetical protein CcrSwift_gp313 [Caulobacter phage CcrSwift]|uniref:Uncharacterized protein n=1 Tax=Caulobacter phage CcrSwift TaxID=2927984 RepID=K4JU07_9CAUD|nr:hypothetical protein D870_gp108 [Caulobacter phage CcrSwift]AFU88631.1 hypothetical protein CcrSwift_gp313 [Caulobacter phage CcrSwift]